ncbi:MAG: CRISPR-associated endonuclease Cas2, partial [Pyrinomonadaceae bacterium]|nr:CRISPR-associated endonuclease Cas2 [Pyrinomonadaceae bacterium]
NSVFECNVDKTRWIVLKERLLQEIRKSEDSLRIYFLDKDVKIEHYGVKKHFDLDDPLIF